MVTFYTDISPLLLRLMNSQSRCTSQLLSWRWRSMPKRTISRICSRHRSLFTCGHTSHQKIALWMMFSLSTHSRWFSRSHHSIKLSCSMLLKFKKALMLLLLLSSSFKGLFRRCRVLSIPNCISISRTSWLG